jgi:hypothetical protein
MKKLILSAVALVMAGSMMAQSNQLSFGLDLALPLGDFGDAYSLGIGPAVGFELPVGDNLGITAQVSYQILMVDNDFIKSASMVPIQAGLKYYLMDQQEGFYGHGMVGVHMQSVTTEDFSFFGLTVPGETTSNTNLSWGIGVGYQLEKLDIGLRFNSILPDSDAPSGVDPNNYIGLRLGYILSL